MEIWFAIIKKSSTKISLSDFKTLRESNSKISKLSSIKFSIPCNKKVHRQGYGSLVQNIDRKTKIKKVTKVKWKIGQLFLLRLRPTENEMASR